MAIFTKNNLTIMAKQSKINVNQKRFFEMLKQHSYENIVYVVSELLGVTNST